MSINGKIFSEDFNLVQISGVLVLLSMKSGKIL